MFLGRTRRDRHPQHGELRRLRYEAYRPMAEQVLRVSFFEDEGEAESPTPAAQQVQRKPVAEGITPLIQRQAQEEEEEEHGDDRHLHSRGAFLPTTPASH